MELGVVQNSEAGLKNGAVAETVEAATSCGTSAMMSRNQERHAQRDQSAHAVRATVQVY